MDMASVSMLVGDWIACYTLDKLANFLSSHLAHHTDLLIGVQDKLKEVQDQLPVIRALIQAAEGRPIRDPALATWLRRLKEASFEADDILDEFDYKQIHHQQLQDRSKVSAFAASALRFLKNLFVSDDELKRLKSLLGDLDKINEEINRKKDELREYKSKQKTPSGETSSFTQDMVFGRDKERDMILNILLSAGDQPVLNLKGAGSSSYSSLCVLPIVGIGGVGKTTLAQLIYNDQRVASYFHIRKWVYVSEDFDLKRISKELESNLPAADSRPVDISLEIRLSRLREATSGERFLFVLDDVWDETGSNWRKLRSALTNGARGSTVIITTQSPLVAEVMGTIDAIKLEVLEEDDYLKLFEHCSFGSKKVDPYLRRKLMSTGQKISEKLHGLPLAAKALGSLLQIRLNETFWKAIQESEWWEHDVVLDSILPSLGLSYQHLSPNLKQCFAYASLFPRGYIFEKERLVHMWMAQGFINSNQLGITEEDIGSQIFDELASRYFFLSTVTNRHVMHDLIRELAVCVSRDDCFVLCDGAVKIPPTVRHLTLGTTRFDVLGDALKIPKLRTLIFYVKFSSSEGSSLEEFFKFLKEIFENQTSLRVVDLSNSRMGIMKMPDAICELSHLRYLDISYTKIRQLPKSFSKLYHLQVLNLRWCQFKKLPEGMNSLIKLRHLYADANTTSLINGIGKLTELQRLEEFCVKRKRGHRITELKELRNLRRRLVIMNLEDIESKEEAMEAKLEDKEHINELLLHRTSTRRSKGDTEKNIFDGLRPHYNLEELRIERYGDTKSPSWLENNMHFINLKSVCLNNLPGLEDLPPFGQLPHLKSLFIWSMPSVRRIGVEFYGKAGPVFPSLEVLQIAVLHKLEMWSDPIGEPICPRLRDLKLDCHNLRRMAALPSIPIEDFMLEQCGDIGNSLSNSLLDWTSLLHIKIKYYLHRTSVCLSNLTMLQSLMLENCPELTLIGGFHSLVNLKSFRGAECAKLIERSGSSQLGQAYIEEDLRSLSHADLFDCIFDDIWFALGRTPSLRSITFSVNRAYFQEQQEEWIGQLRNLEMLHFRHCQNLLKFPASLQLISSLKRLTIWYCQNIEALPENGLPESLRELEIGESAKLIDRCRKDEGPDWHMISEIPYIIFDSEVIQNL